jgi:hypothetical protein
MASGSKSYAPPSDSEGNEGKFGKRLYWPDTIAKYDLLKIDIVDFTPMTQSGLGGIAVSETSSSTPGTATSYKGTLSNVQLSAGAKAKKSLATVLLPVPEGLNYSDSMDWSEENLGAIGKILPSVAKGFTDSNADSIGTNLTTLAQNGLAGMLLSKLSEKNIGFSGEALTQGIAGKVLNPYKEQIFRGVNMRNFSFTWKLVPRSESEQIKIDNIIKTLRYYALPNYSGTSAFEGEEGNTFNELSDRWLSVPRIFRLQWVYNEDKDEIKTLPKIKPCVLTNISVNYTPDGVWATHYSSKLGPSPIAYNLQLDFKETEIITGAEVAEFGTGEGGY